MPKGMIDSYVTPPHSPRECVFAFTTACVSADFKTRITPCQFGGNPDCASCGCIASAALAAVARHKLPGGLRVGAIFERSYDIGQRVNAVRDAMASRDGPRTGKRRGTDRAETVMEYRYALLRINALSSGDRHVDEWHHQASRQ